jgi:CDP-diacylglycerol pyrophosphatase
VAVALSLISSFLCPLDAQKASSPVATAKGSAPPEACERDSGNVLWWLAQTCAKDLKGDPECRVYTKNQSEEYVILKDRSRRKPAGYLMIPAPCVTGIEDSQIFSPGVVDLWQEAWLWSREYPGAPASRTGLAINSKLGRTQNQLHIHISCVRPDVASYLATQDVPVYPAKPVALHLKPDNQLYRAVRVTGLTGEGSPFKVMLAMLGRKDASAVKDGDMQEQSIAVIGSRKENEYYVLLTTADSANDSHAEELLDQSCTKP